MSEIEYTKYRCFKDCNTGEICHLFDWNEPRNAGDVEVSKEEYCQYCRDKMGFHGHTYNDLGRN